MEPTSSPSLFRRLLAASGQSRSARTVELFGWLILVESPVFLVVPNVVATVLHLPELEPQAANYLRLVGLLVGGLGLLYIASGRLNAREFVFASMLDRPLVPPIMAVLWWLGVVPGGLALAFAIQDGGSFAWTLITWRAEQRAKLVPR